MSHYSRVRTQLTDKHCLLKALQDMGFKATDIKVHETAQNLEGYQGDRRADTAEIILPRRAVGGASNDIGFKLQEDGTYGAIVSDYDRGNGACRKNDATKSMTGYNDKWLKMLNQRYTYHKVCKEVEDMGYTVNDVTTANGKIRMQCVSQYGG